MNATLEEVELKSFRLYLCLCLNSNGKLLDNAFTIVTPLQVSSSIATSTQSLTALMAESGRDSGATYGDDGVLKVKDSASHSNSFPDYVSTSYTATGSKRLYMAGHRVRRTAHLKARLLPGPCLNLQSNLADGPRVLRPSSTWTHCG